MFHNPPHATGRSHPTPRRSRLTIATAAATITATLGLAACGGGGGGGDADIQGVWGDPLSNTYVFDLEQDGSSVSGALLVGRPGSSRTRYPLTGRIDGDRFRFHAGDGCTSYDDHSSGVRVVEREHNADTLEGKMDLSTCARDQDFAPVDLFSPRQPD